MTTWRALVPDRFPPGRIEAVAEALILPRDPARRGQPSGILRQDGSMVGQAGQAPEVRSIPAAVTRRAGTWIYGGVLLNHFGHVLVETGARLWAIPVLAERGVQVRGILFIRKKSLSPPAPRQLPHGSRAFLDIFAGGLPVECADQPETVEELLVPEPGLSVTPDRFVGLPEQWRHFRAQAARIEAASGNGDIYIARSGKGARGGYLFEADLEAVLAAAGYRIYHPQTESIAEQIAVYRNARRIVAIDGSALHLAASALRPDTRVAILARRDFFAWALADQLIAASGCSVTVIDPRQRVFNFFGPEGVTEKELRTVKGWSSCFVLPDLARVGTALHQAGMLDPVPAWPMRSEADLSAELARAGKLRSGTLREARPEELALEPYRGAHLSRR